MNPELTELITLDQANRLMAAGAWAAAGAAVVAVAVALLWRPARSRALLAAAAIAPWSLFLSAGWDAYLWRVRFDPATGFCGLHSVRVLATNVLAAIILGLGYGLYLRWVMAAVGKK